MQKWKQKNTSQELAHKDVLFFLDLYGDSLISLPYFQTASLLLRPRP